MIKWLLGTILVMSLNISAQNIYTPVEFRKAIEKGTRTYNGTPGSKYWVNSADYIIDVYFDPETRLLRGSQFATYHNNSPDSLKEIVFKQYQKIYRKGNSRDFALPPSAMNDGVTIKKIIIGGDSVQVNPQDNNQASHTATTVTAYPKKLIAPNSSVDILFDWEYTMPPHTPVRGGTHSDTSYFFSYWYAQIAVYDDIDGWDVTEYDGYTETYNDQNNYEVRITIPNEWLCWGTGVLTNPEAVLSEKALERYNKAQNSNEIVPIARTGETDLTITKGKNNTWVYKATSTPDFAWAIAKNYNWDASTLTLDSGKKIFVDAAFTTSSEDFLHVTQISKEVLKYFSEDTPGVEYPWNVFTVFNGRGGMEFPMIVNDGSYEDDMPSTIGLTAHEAAHSYFPFYMGTNERKHSWMDEGWARLLPTGYQIAKGDSTIKDYFAENYLDYAGTQYDVPMMVPSNELGRNSYRTVAYRRSYIVYEILRDLFGNDKFIEITQEYMNRWAGKHPSPWDFFNTYENVSGKSLGWLWKPWFYEWGYPDLAIEMHLNGKGNREFVINKYGVMPVPVHVTFYFDDNTTQTLKYTAEVWKDKNLLVVSGLEDKPVTKIELNHSWIPDFDYNNNTLILNAE